MQASDNVDIWLTRMEISELITRLYNVMTSKEKAMFFDYFILGMSVQEIATTKRISETAARATLKRLRSKARRIGEKQPL